MLLYEISAGDELSRLVLDQVRLTAPLLDYVHFFYMPGGSAKVRKEASVDAQGLFRTISNDFASKTEGTPDYADYALKIFGKTLKLDRAYEERGGDIPSELKRQLTAFGKTLGRNLNEYLITGDSTASPAQFNGLKKIVAALAASQTLTDTGTNGFQVTAGISDAAVSSQQKFKEMLQILIQSVESGAQLLVMNSRVWSRLSSFAASECDSTIDQFGRRITTYAGIPVVHAGFKFDGSEILPQTETKGTSTDCSSIYAFRSEEQAQLSLMTTRNGLKVYPVVPNGNFFEQTVELQTDSQVLGVRPVAVLPGVRLA